MSFQHTRPKDPRPVNRDKHSEAGMVLACWVGCRRSLAHQNAAEDRRPAAPPPCGSAGERWTAKVCGKNELFV